MRKLICTIMATVLALLLSEVPTLNVEAAEATFVEHQARTPDKGMDFGNLVSTETYVDEYGNIVMDRLYVYMAPGVSPASESGTATFTATKTIKWNGNDAHPESTYYAQGDFTWGNGDVSVTNAAGGIDYVPSLQTISNEKVATGHGKYLGIFNNYAEVTYSFTLTSAVGMSNNYSVTVRVSQSGNQI